MATESNTKFLVTTVVTIVLAFSGYLYTWYQSKQTGLFQAQLDRVSQQLREFYGPLHALIESEDESFQAFVRATRPGKPGFWIDGDPPTREQQKQWRRRITEVTMPNYRAMEQVILKHSDLIVEATMPEELIALQAHIAGYRPVVSAWKEGDYTQNYSFFVFPQDARAYVRGRFAELKKEQEELLGRVSPSPR